MRIFHRKRLLLCSGIVISLIAISVFPRAVPRNSGPLEQEAYVWQRAWQEETRTAIQDHAKQFAQLSILHSEMTWEGQQPKINRAAIDYTLLARNVRSIALVIRVGAYTGPFDLESPAYLTIRDLASSALDEATRGKLSISELQIDFDCAESKLAGYTNWIRGLREHLSPTPVTITALPCWLNNDEFRHLAEVAPGYVLQVHSLERPTSIQSMVSFFDPVKAHAWIEEAARLGVPFRLALPTYTYVLGFEEKTGRLVGLSSEGPSATWIPGIVAKPLQADPAVLARFIQELETDRPALLIGILWFRLPVIGDRFNWPWQTLASVMAGKRPDGLLKAVVNTPERGLTEIELVNEGDALSTSPATIHLAWNGKGNAPLGSLLAFDTLGGFDVVEQTPFGMTLRGVSDLAPGNRRQVAWLRWGNPSEVTVYVEKNR